MDPRLLVLGFTVCAYAGFFWAPVLFIPAAVFAALYVINLGCYLFS